jgi:hypothetical protein
MTPQQFNSDLLAFLAQATTPFHAVVALVSRLEAAGFARLPTDGDWNLEPGQRCYLTRNDSSVLAFTVGSEAGPERGMRMVGAHTDSPRDTDERKGEVPEAERGLEVEGLAVTHHFRAVVAKGEIERRGQDGDPDMVIKEEEGGGGVEMFLIGRVKRRQGRDKLPNGVEGHVPGRREGRRQGGGVERGQRGEELVWSSGWHILIRFWHLYEI